MFFADEIVVVVVVAVAVCRRAGCRWRNPWIGGGMLWGEVCSGERIETH